MAADPAPSQPSRGSRGGASTPGRGGSQPAASGGGQGGRQQGQPKGGGKAGAPKGGGKQGQSKGGGKAGKQGGPKGGGKPAKQGGAKAGGKPGRPGGGGKAGHRGRPDHHRRDGRDETAAQLAGPLQRVLKRLPETQRRVLEYRMGLVDGHPHDLADTARALGLSMSEAREIEKRAFEHIREAVPLQQLQRFLER
jgi:hypothetical protein